MRILNSSEMARVTGGGCDDLIAAAILATAGGQPEIAAGIMLGWLLAGCGSAT